MSDLRTIDEIMCKAAHEAGKWDTPWFRCTQCEELVWHIRKALTDAGYVIAVDPSPEALLRRSEAALAPLSE